MRFLYESDFTDFKQAQRTLIRSDALRRVRFHFFMWGLPLMGVALLFVFALSPRPSHAWVGSLQGAAVGGCIGGGLVPLLLRPWLLRRAYKNMRSGPRAGAALYLEIDGSILRSGYEGTSEGAFQRSAICRVAEDENMLLLFVTQRVFLYLPKHRLPPEAITEVHRWLQQPGAPPQC